MSPEEARNERSVYPDTREELGYFHVQPHFSLDSFKAVRKKSGALWPLIFGTKGVMTSVLLWVAFHSMDIVNIFGMSSLSLPYRRSLESMLACYQVEYFPSSFPYSSCFSVSKAILTATSQKQIRNLESREIEVPIGPKWSAGCRSINMSKNKQMRNFNRSGMTN